MAEATRDPSSSQEDRALLESCMAGDEAAWSRLVDRYGRMVYSIPYRYGLRPETCEDVFQNVFSIVLRQLPALKDLGSFPKWLITISVRESLWALRQARVRGERGPDPDAAPPPENELGAIEERQIIRESLAELGGPCRALLEALFSADEPDYSAIAAGLSMPIGSIGPTRGRCLGKLREIIRRRLGPLGG